MRKNTKIKLSMVDWFMHQCDRDNLWWRCFPRMKNHHCLRSSATGRILSREDRSIQSLPVFCISMASGHVWDVFKFFRSIDPMVTISKLIERLTPADKENANDLFGFPREQKQELEGTDLSSRFLNTFMECIWECVLFHCSGLILWRFLVN